MGVTRTQPLPRLKPGAVVRCRTRRYLVESVQPEKEKDRKPGCDTVVAMACHSSSLHVPARGR